MVQVETGYKEEKQSSLFLREKHKEWGENEEFIFRDYEFELHIRCLIQMSHRSGTQKIWPRDTDSFPSMGMYDITWDKEYRMRRRRTKNGAYQVTSGGTRKLKGTGTGKVFYYIS